ncbi:methylmalonate-semialdehyde dehydrogenase [acylating], mitochondrial-like [Actinidia eriantha]|uniref:methylmalonate-semialdehyde dehydrogenase [acylating], mitochondrial-like n=1 Tax=Actinidia eriantha TaxID=165200 RepID=UPI00258B5E59|nr:methylmalonate-semialdehyde dehydrogenase [acylating], mitochondrial-like [Actinidia eriantha]
MESQSLLEVTRQKMMLPPSPGTFRDREDLVSYVRDFGASQGYVVTIKKSRKDRKVILGCDRGGTYQNRRKVEEYIRKRKASSRLINCPFEAIGKKDDDVWVLVIKNGEHNHEPLNDMSEHPYSRRFTEQEVRQIKLMTEAGIKPRQVLNALKQSNPELQSTPRHLYNLKAKIRQGNFSEKSFKSWRPNKSVPVNTSLEASAAHYDPVNVPNLIGGKFVDSQACAIVDVLNPATQEVVSQVPLTTYEEFKYAVSAAKQAFPSWKNTLVATRQHIKFTFQELIHRDIDKLAMNISREQGKTLNGAKVDLLRGLEVVEFACGMASLQMGESVPNASNGIDAYCTREPLGVCAGICPSNFPTVISLWMFPIAVTCGNTYILKTSEKSAGDCYLLMAFVPVMDFNEPCIISNEAGLPDGVLNVVHGTNDIVHHICDDDGIKAISFTGFKYTKNHAIIMPDASADATLDALVAAGFGATGQTCMALSKAVFVGGSLPWEEELVERAKKLKVNVGTEPGADLGPVTTKEICNPSNNCCIQTMEMLSPWDLQSNSMSNHNQTRPYATCFACWADIKVPGYEHGNFVGPTILCDVTASMECYKEEIFGPVLLCLQADSLEEAITIVNGNGHGHGASIFTTSSIAARNFQNEIEAGLVGVNVPVPIALPFSSFNGFEASCAGKAGVQFYTKIKAVAQK